ncbi:hypothetical protein [Enterococcus sp. DIV0187]|uniref:hypothetical protein n=1 Tax=Enterococcus sp. DIV0187 TaxID=2774644 RepID=UPI003F2845C0
MFGHWQTHSEYLMFTQNALKKIPLEFQEEYTLSFQQFQLLNLDPVIEIISPLYSHTGRAANRKLTLNQLPHMLKISPMFHLIAGILNKKFLVLHPFTTLSLVPFPLTRKINSVLFC